MAVVTSAGVPIVAFQAASSMSTTGAGQLPKRHPPELLRRQLLEGDLLLQDLCDDADLLGLAQRLRAGEDVVASRVPVLPERQRGDGRDVTFVDWCGLGSAVGPPDGVTRTDRGRPPVQRVRPEHAGPDESPLQPRPRGG